MKGYSFVILFILLYVSFVYGGVAGTKHNLSISGPGTIKAQSEREICIFCHTPHNASPAYPLWNHDLSAVTNYTNYWSPTLNAYQSEAQAPEPDGFSKLCLSCHDGTVALGAVRSRTTDIAMVGGVTTMPPSSKGFIGTDLSGSHPISFIVTQALIDENNLYDSPLNSLSAMKTDPRVKLDNNNKVQCTSCHNPHDDSNFATSGIRFWNKPIYSEVCNVCHNI